MHSKIMPKAIPKVNELCVLHFKCYKYANFNVIMTWAYNGYANKKYGTRFVTMHFHWMIMSFLKFLGRIPKWAEIQFSNSLIKKFSNFNKVNFLRVFWLDFNFYIFGYKRYKISCLLDLFLINTCVNLVFVFLFATPGNRAGTVLLPAAFWLLSPRIWIFDRTKAY